MFKTKIRTLLSAIALGTLLTVSGAGRADEAKVPETGADHEVMAKTYQEKAASYRKDADWHKEMAAAYAKANPDSKGGVKNSWNVKMQKHCKAMVITAEKLATEAQKAADFHSLRGKELQGK
jgi:hypothetical protein